MTATEPGYAGSSPFEEWPPDPMGFPLAYEGVTARRLAAYFLDLAVLLMVLIVLYMAFWIVTLMSLGLLWPLHILLTPLLVGLIYHIGQVASPAAATIGMRLFGLRVWSVRGGRPEPLQAAVHGFCYYGSMAVTGGLVALVALFNPRRQTLHDMLAGVVVLREA